MIMKYPLFVTIPTLFHHDKPRKINVSNKQLSTFNHSKKTIICSLDESFSSLSNQDWRSFRAKLVQSEKQQDSTADTINSSDENNRETWAHHVPFVERGSLLIASPEHFKGEFACSFFANTVVYVIEHDSSADSGSTGIILNRPIAPTAGKLRSNKVELTDDINIPLYLGGPVDLGSALLLHHDRFSNNSAEDGIKILQFHEALDKINTANMTRDNYRLFCGYAGWAASQLEEEINNGVWYTCCCSEDLVMRNWTEHLDLPKLVLNLMGGRYKEISRMIGGEEKRA